MTKSVSHLLNEPTIPVYPTLAKLIGINQAIILQQLHFLLNVTQKANKTNNYIDGRWWVYNSYEEWRDDHFIWLSTGSIKRQFLEMEKDGYIISMQGVKTTHDRKKWYTVDYAKWEAFVTMHETKSADASAQNETMHSLKMSRSIVSKRDDEVLTETTTENKESAPKKRRAKNPNEDLHHALVRAFGLEPAEMTPTADSAYWKVAAELKAISVSAEQVPKIAQALKNKAKREGWNGYTVAALSKYAPELLKSSANDNIYADFDRMKIITVTEEEAREMYGE